MHKIIRQAVKSAALVACVTLMSSCGTTPTKPSAITLDESLSLDNITQRLDEADQLDSEQRTRVYLDVSQRLIDAGEIDWARNTHAQIAAYSISDAHFIQYSVVSATLALAQGEPFIAKRYLWNNRVDQVAPLSSNELRAKLHEKRAELMFGLGEYRVSVAERLTLSELLPLDTPESDINQDILWQTLMELPYTDLRLESQIQSEMVLKGWYTLAALSKNNQTNLQLQIDEVHNWVLNWPEHPASLRPPADLQLLQELADEQPKHIAILLPFSGRIEAAAHAIRDGVMAAYYDAAADSTPVPVIRIYDTTSGDIDSIYDNAILEGAQLVIGPLEQGRIEHLALRPTMSVPTLALNRITNPAGVAAGLFQFGLPIEDEARQVADQAWRDGHRRAMILAPGTTNGDRSVKSFSERWLELGGELIKDYRYKDQKSYLNLVKNAVKVEDSEKRKNRVRTIIGKQVEFEPRRRKDIDFIFLYSRASQARQIKPILAFHYSGDIPVYAIKSIYNGKTDTKLDRDLNNIRFTTLPWFFDNDLPERKAINAHNQSPNYQFFYALGVDAFHIHPRLRQLLEVKQAHFYGATGKLSLDDEQKITREQIWAKFSNGVAQPVATFTTENDL